MYTKEMTIYEVLQSDKKLADIFFSFGMHCLGCPISRGESIEQAAAAHGIELDKLMAALNLAE